MNSSKEITFRTKQIHKRRFFLSAKEKKVRREEKPSFVYLCIRVRAKEITALVHTLFCFFVVPFRLSSPPCMMLRPQACFLASSNRTISEKIIELGLARSLWVFCEIETSRETNLARRDFSRD